MDYVCKEMRWRIALTALMLCLVQVLHDTHLYHVSVRMARGGAGGILSVIKTPLGAVLMLVVTLILAGLTVASAVSGDLTAAAISAAGLIVIVLIIAMLNLVGK